MKISVSNATFYPTKYPLEDPVSHVAGLAAKDQSCALSEEAFLVWIRHMIGVKEEIVEAFMNSGTLAAVS